MSIVRAALICASLVGAFSVVTGPTRAAPLAEVRVVQGVISGDASADGIVRIFKGVPFAAPPVGTLRWRPPQPPVAWKGMRAANAFAPSCLQPPRTGRAAQLLTSQRLGTFDEDCLYLNIWTAAKAVNDRLPVMVWFPGGGFTTGGGSALVFDGESLARKGVIVVTTNYRLGALGFFAHPELTKETNGEPTGNFGLMDQTAALRWVQQNIAMFGGDRNRVTIFGQSAGATSVLYQTALPGTKGLFQRAIGESSGGTGGILALDRILTRAEAETAGLNTARALGVTSLSDLRAVSATRLLAVHQAHGPFVDGRLVADAPDVVLAAGRHNDVPLLVGSNVENGNTRQPFFDTYTKTYPRTSPEEANGEAMAWRVRRWADLQTKGGRSKAYLYYFTRAAPPGGPGGGAAYHGAELPYVFRNLHLFDFRWSPVDRRLEELVSSYWVNFARSGDPNSEGLPRWPPYERSNGSQVMVLDEKVGPGKSRLDDAKIALFDAYRQTLTSN